MSTKQRGCNRSMLHIGVSLPIFTFILQSQVRYKIRFHLLSPFSLHPPSFHSYLVSDRNKNLGFSYLLETISFFDCSQPGAASSQPVIIQDSMVSTQEIRPEEGKWGVRGHYTLSDELVANSLLSYRADKGNNWIG